MAHHEDIPSERLRHGRRRVWYAASAIAIVLAAFLSAVNVWFGPLNHDEGWYLLAARNFSRGMMPYRDFMFTQGPALPLLYGAFAWAWTPFGVLGGRVFTAILGFSAALLFACVAGKSARRIDSRAAGPAAFFAFALTALSPDWAYFAVIPKTYALGAFFLAAGFFLISLEKPLPALSGACFALAAATRATLCLAAVPVFASLVLQAFLDRRRRVHAFRFAIGCAIALGALYAPVLVMARDNFVFSQTYHTARAAAPLSRWLVLRAAFVCFLAQGYPALFAAAALLVAAVPRVKQSGLRATISRWLGFVAVHPLFVATAVSFALLSLAHFLVPFPYADYNTPAMPLASVALAAPLGVLVVRSSLRPAVVAVATLTLLLAFVAASPWPMKWVGGHQDRFWFATDSQTPLARLREAGRVVRDANRGGSPILSQDAYLAVEAGCDVVPGLEMGPFSLFPALDDETARARRVHNLSTLTKAIETSGAQVATAGGYTFAMECPSTDPLDAERRAALLSTLERVFPVVAARWDRFGQQDTPLEIRLSAGEKDEKSGSGEQADIENAEGK